MLRFLGWSTRSAGVQPKKHGDLDLCSGHFLGYLQCCMHALRQYGTVSGGVQGGRAVPEAAGGAGGDSDAQRVVLPCAASAAVGPARRPGCPAGQLFRCRWAQRHERRQGLQGPLPPVHQQPYCHALASSLPDCKVVLCFCSYCDLRLQSADFSCTNDCARRVR